MMPKFDLGKIVATPGALEALERSGQDACFFLHKHAAGDLGDVCGADEKANNIALREGGRFGPSEYRTLKGDTLFVITEFDRSITTILLPEDY